MNLFRQQKFSIRKFNVGIFSALPLLHLYLLTRQQRLQQSKISLHKINQHNQLMPMHSLTQMLVLKLILQHNQLHLRTKDNQQHNQQTKVDRLIQQEAQHNQQEAQHNRQQVQHNQLDKVIKLIQITLHKHNLEIKQHRQTKQDKEITKQHRQIKHSQRMLQQQRNQQHL